MQRLLHMTPLLNFILQVFLILGELSIPGINAYCREFGGGRMS